MNFLKITPWGILSDNLEAQAVMAVTLALAVAYVVLAYRRKLEKFRLATPGRPLGTARWSTALTLLIRGILITFSPLFMATMVVHYYTEPSMLGAGGYLDSVAVRFTYSSGFILLIVLILCEVRDYFRRRALKGGEV